MKPKIILVVERDGGILITKEDLQELVDEVYEQGKIDGQYLHTTNPITVKPKPTGIPPRVIPN